jgi:tetratricopeptide (TPR) repeat protein
MASAIELYRDAYDQDYRKGNWEYAEELYKRIIEQFPYSEEKEYARIHLERIAALKADPHNQALQPVKSSSGLGILTGLNFFLLLVCIAGGVGLGYFVWQGYQSRIFVDMVLEGLVYEKASVVDAAQFRYKKAQEIAPMNPLGYRLSAELHLSTGRLDQAETGLKQWAIVSPTDPGLADFGARLKGARQVHTQGAMR